MTTNATSIDDKVVEAIIKYKIAIMVSLARPLGTSRFTMLHSKVEWNRLGLLSKGLKNSYLGEFIQKLDIP